MKINEIYARLPAWYYSSLADGGAPPCVTSAPGRGKTSVLRLFPKAMKKAGVQGDFGFRLVNGATMTLNTIMGYMWPSDDIKGRKMSDFTMPYWWYVLMPDGSMKGLDEFDGGVLLIDEADKLGIDEKKIVGEAALSKVLGNHQLPPGWVVWFAMNRTSDRSGSTRDLDHLITRRRDIPVRDDIECTVEHFRSKGLLPEVITFAEENAHLVFMDKPEVQGPYCTPRGVEASDIHLQALMRVFGTDKIPTDPITQEEISGGIGAPAAAQLFVTIKLGQELPSYEEIVKNPTVVKVPSKPDGKRLIAYKLAHRVTVEDAPKVLEYMARIDVEFQSIFLRLAAHRNYQLIFQKDMAAWCAKNASLIAILNRYRVDSE